MRSLVFAFLLFASLSFAQLAHSIVNFPYPQESSYGYGTINTASANASANLKDKFADFMARFYEEGTCKGTPCARIKFDNASQTVSEGIGYGMIMMVYFSDTTTSYQSHLDKLWAYYNSWLNQNGLMNWQVNGFSNVDGQNAATDAEFDVALALAMAYYQFGDEKYNIDASALIAKVRQHEMENNGLHKPGDAWNDKKNPSYVSPAAFEIFKDLDDAEFWSKALEINYALLKNNQNDTTGLPTDWSGSNGELNQGDYYGYDASRAPWRWAWANAWYGHEDAKTLLAKLAPWVNGKEPSALKGTIKADGTQMWNDHNSTFTGPLMNTLSYSSVYQSKKDAFWNQLMSFSKEQYFSAALQVLTGLLSSGNMPNLKALSEGSGGDNGASSSSSEDDDNSSSSSDDAGDTNSSSSSVVSSGNSSSSSSDGNSPIIPLSQIAGKNAAQLISNGLSLQVAQRASLEVFGLNGNSVRKMNFERGIYSVQLSDMPKGLYIAKIRYGNSGTEVLKVPVK